MIHKTASSIATTSSCVGLLSRVKEKKKQDATSGTTGREIRAN